MTKNASDNAIIMNRSPFGLLETKFYMQHTVTSLTHDYKNTL